MIEGDLVLVHLAQPAEKLWGLLLRLRPEGVVIRGIHLDSFDDWVRGVARAEPSLGLTTLFVPMLRVEKIFLDEQVGEVESYRQRFERIVGERVDGYLGLSPPEPSGGLVS